MRRKPLNSFRVPVEGIPAEVYLARRIITLYFNRNGPKTRSDYLLAQSAKSANVICFFFLSDDGVLGQTILIETNFLLSSSLPSESWLFVARRRD